MNWLNNLTVEQKSTYTAILTVFLGVLMFSVGIGFDIQLAVNTFLIITGLICGVGGLLWIGVMVEDKKIQLFKED